MHTQRCEKQQPHRARNSPVYLLRWRIFRRLRLSRRIRFFLHCGWGGGGGGGARVSRGTSTVPSRLYAGRQARARARPPPPREGVSRRGCSPAAAVPARGGVAAVSAPPLAAAAACGRLSAGRRGARIPAPARPGARAAGAPLHSAGIRPHKPLSQRRWPQGRWTAVLGPLPPARRGHSLPPDSRRAAGCCELPGSLTPAAGARCGRAGRPARPWRPVLAPVRTLARILKLSRSRGTERGRGRGRGPRKGAAAGGQCAPAAPPLAKRSETGAGALCACACLCQLQHYARQHGRAA